MFATVLSIVHCTPSPQKIANGRMTKDMIVFWVMLIKFEYASEIALIKIQMEGLYPLGFCTFNEHPNDVRSRENKGCALISLHVAEELAGKA